MFGPSISLVPRWINLGRVGVDRTSSATRLGLAHQLADGLARAWPGSAHSAGNRSAIVAFADPVDMTVTRAALDRARGRVSVRENGAQIRVSPALFNTAEDVWRFLELADEPESTRGV